MISTRLFMITLVCGILVSLFCGQIATLIDCGIGLVKAEDHVRHPLTAGWQRGENDQLDYSSSDDLIWFVQISDLHISEFRDPARIAELGLFVNKSLSAISPQLVLASGDLTDAKNSDNIGSTQYEQEWKTYKDVLTRGGVYDTSYWLDIRGNHDLFDVPSPASSENFFRQYGVQGAAHARSYLYTLPRGRRRYAFVALDATLEPGPKRPFNFFGVVGPREMAALQEYARKASEADHVVWFGHYPTSTLVPSGQVRRLMTGSLAYVCGHLHTLGGLVRRMYTRHHQGTLELELGDWKDNRMYRVLAIDHGLLSFVDVFFGEQWPVVMVTSPKSTQTQMPRTEPLWIQQQMPHIRVLVFSEAAVTSVRARVDGSATWAECRPAGDTPALYLCQWRPEMYSSGLHTVQVEAADAAGRRRHSLHSFSLDGSSERFPLLARLVLMLDLSLVCQFGFALLLISCVLPPAVLRIVIGRAAAGRRRPLRPGRGLVGGWMRRLIIFSSVDRLYWPHVAMLLYLPLGPWLVGELITGHYGVVFSWGSFVAGAFLPGLLQFAYGSAQVALLHLPLLLACAALAQLRFDVLFRPERGRSRCQLLAAHLALLAACLLQLMSVVMFHYSYGWVATVLGPFRTWTLVVALRMWYSAARLPREALRTAAVALASEVRVDSTVND